MQKSMLFVILANFALRSKSCVTISIGTGKAFDQSMYLNKAFVTRPQNIRNRRELKLKNGMYKNPKASITLNGFPSNIRNNTKITALITFIQQNRFQPV